MFLGGRGPGRVRSRRLEGRRKQGVFSAVRTPPAGASRPPGKLTSVCLSCQAAAVLQAAFRGHLARARLLSSAACVLGRPRVPSPPTQVHRVFTRTQVLSLSPHLFSRSIHQALGPPWRSCGEDTIFQSRGCRFSPWSGC